MAGLFKVAAGTTAAVLAAALTGAAAVPDEAVARPVRAAAALRAADLVVSKTVSPNPMTIGARAVYKVTVTNTGDRPAADVTVTDALPSGVTAGTMPAGCSLTGRTATCGGAGVTVSAGGSVAYEIPVTVDSGLSDGANLTNRADVATSTADARTQGTRLISQAHTLTDVEITKTGPATAAANGDITYTITVVNHGPSDAVDVTVQDPTNGNLTAITDLPAECPASGLTVSCPLGTLTSGETRTFTFTVRANAGLADGTAVQNCAMVYTGSRETTTDNNHSCTGTSVGPPPTTGPQNTDISVRKSGPARVNPNGTLTYTLVVSNDGDADATDVVVMDPIDEHATLVGFPAECAENGGTLNCTLGTLPAHRTRTIKITERVDGGTADGTRIVNCATTQTTRPERSMARNASCVDTVVEEGRTATPAPTGKPTKKPTRRPTKRPRPPKPGPVCRCYGPNAVPEEG
ncbi:DUF11 domain-containing protein [Actinomadura parmotrematis]|uniref:DUF11 domain-containing protein n=1 Tax=Actinomadura parmotrematis TaxID=2864039 RepID=A0ABS7FLJ4_9ACTN|nr:DUF11 domain-containing protein [Actinomadura parmotrematis]MBW8481248.1 DUF11 domain-containing protein [Actinomadura parmotrematis]